MDGDDDDEDNILFFIIFISRYIIENFGKYSSRFVIYITFYHQKNKIVIFE